VSPISTTQLSHYLHRTTVPVSKTTPLPRCPAIPRPLLFHYPHSPTTPTSALSHCFCVTALPPPFLYISTVPSYMSLSYCHSALMPQFLTLSPAQCPAVSGCSALNTDYCLTHCPLPLSFCVSLPHYLTTSLSHCLSVPLCFFFFLPHFPTSLSHGSISSLPHCFTGNISMGYC
jgi:hypothetical protein